MTRELIFMIERFPSYKIEIMELYDRDQDFRQLCNDYCLTLNMLEAFRITEPDIKKVQYDYEQVSEELEKELMKILKK